MEEKARLKTLFQELKAGNIDAFDEIYALTKKAVYFAIYLVFKDETITEDLMQETYIDFLEKQDKVKENADITGFLVMSAKNKALNYYNKNKYEREYAQRFVNESYSMDPSYDTGLLKLIHETLSEKEYDVFILKVLGDYSFKEISKMRKIPIGTCTWLYQEARQKLEQKLGGLENARR